MPLIPKMMLCPNCWGSDPKCEKCGGTFRIPDLQLSKHFWLSEMLKSGTAVRRGLSNYPTLEITERLGHLCENLMEPIREKFGPIKVNSGYRAPLVNGNVSGSSSTSAHPHGYACDFESWKGVSLKTIVDWIIAHKTLKFDQVIYEGTWIHIGEYYPLNKAQRGQQLMMFPEPKLDPRSGKPMKDGKGNPVFVSKYHAYNPKDPRVI